MSHDHRTTHTIVHTVLYDRHTTNTVSYDHHTTDTVQVRIIHGQVQPDTVSTSVQSSCMNFIFLSNSDKFLWSVIIEGIIVIVKLCEYLFKSFLKKK